RIGRTGRAGRSGRAFTLVTRGDTKYLDAIEKLIGQNIEWMNGDISTLPAPMESHDSGRKGRDRDKGRGRGKRGESASVSEAAIVNEPVEEVIVEARAEQVKPERKTERRSPTSGSGNRQSHPANDDHRERRARHHRDQDDGPTPVGFGDDIPAFMLVVASAGKA